MGKKKKAIKTAKAADLQVSRVAWKHKHSPAARALGLIGKLTDQPPLFAFAGGIALAGLIRRDRRIMNAGVRMALSHLISMYGKDSVKRVVDRTRPQMLMEEGRHQMKAGNHRAKELTSFPSGHTAGAVAIAQALLRECGDYAPIAYGAAAAAAVARVAECDHFVSDTAAGAVIGWAAEKIADLALNRAPLLQS